MHLRRAVLLFAIVLGLAAVAASLAPPPAERERREEPPPAPAPPAERLPPDRPQVAEFPARAGRLVTRQVEAGERAVVEVRVDSPGEVSIDGLGLLQAADPATPAVFDVLPSRSGSYAVRFAPIEAPARQLGLLRVR